MKLLLISVVFITATSKEVIQIKYDMTEKVNLENVNDTSLSEENRKMSEVNAEEAVLKPHMFVPQYENNGTRFKIVHERAEN
ncbi:unnamed protein product [Parnassius apollo]|uniref:(apollo) hypothetical protein n=1 Tax=Parnassius apollo TaxID=110799 RepID=A0A8S3Y5Y4_PARAO|nr:unnamed protein product [Parnassius apollo]